MIKQAWMTIIAGEELVNAMEAEQKAKVEFTGFGYDSEQLCVLQGEQSRRGIIGVEIVCSMYGHSVRYDSGLANFGLVRSGKGVSLENAEQWCRDWVAQDPTKRYAWRRN